MSRRPAGRKPAKLGLIGFPLPSGEKEGRRRVAGLETREADWFPLLSGQKAGARRLGGREGMEAPGPRTAAELGLMGCPFSPGRKKGGYGPELGLNVFRFSAG
jgi:hypothetical protein